MDALLSSLHSLSLLPPSPSQLFQLLSSPSTPVEEEKARRDLARVLSLGSYDDGADEGDSRDDEGVLDIGGFAMERELIEDAIVELIKRFKVEINRLRAAYEAEEGLQLAPQPLPKVTPLKFLKLRHESALRQSEKLNSIYGGYRPKLIFSGGQSYSSIAELADLSQISGKQELEVGRRLQGKYLVGRVASSIAIYVGVTFLLTLPAPLGFSIPVSVSHFTKDPRMSSVEASALLPIGTLLIIKEPYVSPNHSIRTVGSLDGVGIRVDTPTDVVILKAPNDPYAKESDDWTAEYLDSLQWIAEIAPSAKTGKGHQKDDASRLQLSSAHEGAEEADSDGAASTSKLRPLWLQDGPLSRARPLSYSNPSTSPNDIVERIALPRLFVSEDRPGAAWREMTAAAGSQPSSVQCDGQPLEALELKGDILTAMSAWEEAEAAYIEAAAVADVLIQREAMQEKLSQTRQRRAEADIGPSPSGSTIASIYQSHLSSTAPRIPAADWLSSALRVARIPNAGRGLVTTRHVKAGDPLLLAKSREPSYPSDYGLDQYSPIIRCDFETGVISTTTQILATTKLIHQMIDRPELTSEILGLTAGPGLPDSDWVERDRFEKAKLCTGLGGTVEWLRPDRIGPAGGIDSHYVDEVLRHNAFGPGAVQRGFVTDDRVEARKTRSNERTNAAQAHTTSSLPRALQRKLAQDPPSAFSRSTQPHPLPAIINHSCLPNVSSVFLGDTVVIKALRDLKEGEEVVHEYVRGGLDYQTRQATLSKHGFVCACILCDLDRQDGEVRLATRRKLFAVQGPALSSRSDALLAHANGPTLTTELHSDSEDYEKHQDIRKALESFACELADTYDERRGTLRPEMRDILERIGRHAEREGRLDQTIESYLLSLQAVDARLHPRWIDYLACPKADRPLATLIEIDAFSSLDSLSTSTSTSKSSLALTQCPALHVDEAQRTVWRLAQLFASLTPSPTQRRSKQEQTRLSLHFSRTAYHLHDILIGGGFEVFEDRWGPSGLDGRSKGLEWQEAWDLWVEEEHPRVKEEGHEWRRLQGEGGMM